MLREMFHFTFANEFFLTRHLAQEMNCILKGGFRFSLSRFAQQEMNFEFLLRIVQRDATAQPLVRLLADAAGVNEIEGDRFVEVPDVILPSKAEVVLIVLRFNR